MGLDVNGTRFLLYARNKGVSFERTAMIGRQGLHLDAAALNRNLSEFGCSLSETEISRLLSESGGYAEPLLRLLGADEVCSFDASDYEQASVIHDFNLPIDESFRNRFSVVLDGGTLEHIFNFPTAIRNCLKMIEPGGCFLGITPANNFLGHGFYQFSPELFFRIFSQQNGFSLVQMLLFEDRPDAEWFEVTDPDLIRERVTLVNQQPVYLLIIARKQASVQLFASPPQQSDYAALWKQNAQPALFAAMSSGSGSQPAGSGRVSALLRRAMRLAARQIRGRRALSPDGTSWNPRFFRKIRVP
ncbi:MAG: hypothetical protein U0Z53_04570 [Blastocatellia bacterium]